MTSAYAISMAIHTRFHVPVFPVLLEEDPETGKWQKRPLAKWRHTKGDPGDSNWARANAVGVPMGERSGLLTVDVDNYKPRTADELEGWLARHDLSAARVHRTASGGRHHILQLPRGATFTNRAPEVRGLDVRGEGGFIVWADLLGRYTVECDVLPGPMARSLKDELTKLNACPRRLIEETPEPNWIAIDGRAIETRVRQLVADSVKNPQLARRWRGDTTDLKDVSRSGLDMSMASLLAREGFSYDQIVWVLLSFFPHGKAARDGWHERTEREARRAAWRARGQVEEEHRERRETMMKLAQQSVRRNANKPRRQEETR